MRWTEDEYKKFLAGVKAKGSRPMPGTKSNSSRKPKKKVEVKGRGKAESQSSYRVVVVAKRKREIDPDNVFPKWAIDELVKAGYLEDDSSKFIASIEKRVELVRSADEEETIIEIWREC